MQFCMGLDHAGGFGDKAMWEWWTVGIAEIGNGGLWELWTVGITDWGEVVHGSGVGLVSEG